MGSSGLGPIRAISPLNTLINCGNSSKLVDRTNRPTFVKRCASGSRFPSVSRSSVIVLNLITLNIIPSLPGLSCVKNTPAPLLAKCNHIVTTNNIGLIQINAMSDIQKSKKRLNICLYIVIIRLQIERFSSQTSYLPVPDLQNFRC